MSGNGIRCLVQAAVDAGWVSPGPVSCDDGRRAPHGRATAPGTDRVSATPASTWAAVTLGPELDAGALAGGDRAVGRASTSTWATPTSCSSARRSTTTVVASVGPPPRASVPGGANVEFVWPGTDSDEPHHAGVGARRGRDPGLRHRRLRGGGGRPQLGAWSATRSACTTGRDPRGRARRRRRLPGRPDPEGGRRHAWTPPSWPNWR